MAAHDGDVPVPVAGRPLPAGRSQDFTHLRLDGVGAVGIDVGQSLFIGALIEGGAFRRVDFSRCDFSGTRIVRGVFEDCSFRLADVRSCRFEETRFARCDFGSSQIGRTDCRATTFEACRFEECTLLEGAMEETTFEGCSFRGASVTGGEFSSCSFVDTGFSDCTALYLLFEACRFERFAINAESVGYTYGLTRADLAGAKLVHLGGAEAPPGGEDPAVALASSYRARRWFIGAAIIEVNFALGRGLPVFQGLADRMLALERAGLPSDADELEFLVRVLERLHARGALPLLAARDVDRVLRRIVGSPDGPPQGRAALLALRSERLVMSLLDDACAIVGGVPSAEASTLELRLARRPARPLDALCRHVVSSVHGADATIEFVSGREGSWVENWQMLPSVLATVQLVLLAVNGLLKELEKAVATSRRLDRALRGPKSRGARAKKAEPSDGPRNVALLEALDEGVLVGVDALRRRASLLSDERLERVERTLAAVDEMPSADFENLGDYAAGNVLAVKVEPARKAAGRRSRGRAPAS